MKKAEGGLLRKTKEGKSGEGMKARAMSRKKWE